MKKSLFVYPMAAMFSHPSLIKPLVFAVAAAASGHLVAAEIPVPSAKLAPVVVSATRVEESVDEVNRPVAVIERREIETIQPQSIADIVKYQPNVSVAGGPRASNQSINIRGLVDEKILQTIDGVRQSFDSGHRPSYFLDPELVKSVEVVKGPVSSLWGSGAVGGVVSQNTVTAADLLKADQLFGGFVKGGYNDNNNGKDGTIALAARTDQIDLLFSTYYRDSDDLEMGNGYDLIGSATRDQGALAKAEWQIDEQQSLSFNYRQSEESGHVPMNGQAQLTDTSNQLIDRDTELQNLSLGYDLDTESELLNAKALLFWSEIDMAEYRPFDGSSDNTNQETIGLSLNNLSKLGPVSLLYGIDGYRESFSAVREGDTRPKPPEAESDVWGAFVQAKLPFAQVWQAEFGVRYDRFATEVSNLTQDRSDNDVSPSVALSWQAQDWLKLTLRHDQAFRAPGSEELYTTGTHFCLFPGFCNTFISNPELNPEKSANTELMANMQWRFADDQTLRAQVSLFENHVDDFIEQIVTPPSFGPVMDAGNTTWVNVDEASIRGFEIATHYQAKQLSAKLAYGQTRGEDDKTGEDLTNIPADTITAELSYALLNEQLELGTRVTHASDQSQTHYEENPDGRTYDGYTVTDLYASWSPHQVEGLKLDLTINNVTDRHYRIAWEELDEAGREVLLAARYRF